MKTINGNPNLDDLTGRRFGKLQVLCRAPSRRSKGGQIKTCWKCLCDCGSETTVSRASLIRGSTRSCGCLHAISVVKHGMYKSVEYKAWEHMKERCLNRNDCNYARYGARGISICPEWAVSFMAFFAHVGKRPSENHSLERIDNNGHYEPGNVIWALRERQARNTRRNRMIEYEGRKMCLVDWSAELQIPYSILTYRLKKWSIEKALTTPVTGKDALRKCGTSVYAKEINR